MSERLWVDANVLLRFLTGEPPAMAEESRLLMTRVVSGEVRLKVTPLILAEVLWVLKSFYGYGLDRIRNALVPLLAAPGIETEDRDLAVAALALAAEKNVDFVDAYLSLRAQAAGEAVCTFDATDFRRLPSRWTLPSDLAQ